MDTKKLKSDPHDKPVWVSWYGRDGIHGFRGQSDNEIEEGDENVRERRKALGNA